MVTLATPTLDQQIRLDAVAIDGRLAAKRLVTTRTAGIAGVLAKQRIDDLPQILSRLFPLCGTAHAIAGLTAIERALAIDLAPAQYSLRELMLQTEHGAALGWRILMDWPPLLGITPDVTGCANIRRAAAAVSAVAGRGAWARLGGTRLRPERNGLRRSVSELAGMLVALFPEATDPAQSWEKLERVLHAGASTPARLIDFARAGTMADYGRHNCPLLAPKDADWFADRLAAEPHFSDAPTLDGTPAEVGPLAARRHPLIADAVAHWGPTLATRLLAAALDAQVVAERLLRALEGLADDDPPDVDLRRDGSGAGMVETARGPLAYFVEIVAGRVTRLRSVAPTEWNFHSHGPFMAALDAAPRVADPAFAARLLAASFDPCVPFKLDVTDDERSPTNAELALHA